MLYLRGWNIESSCNITVGYGSQQSFFFFCPRVKQGFLIFSQRDPVQCSVNLNMSTRDTELVRQLLIRDLSDHTPNMDWEIGFWVHGRFAKR